MKSIPSNDPAALRRAAEARLKEKSAARPPQTEGDLRRLQHELEVHQIELEMQNEELQAARAEITTALEHYTGLFDFAPVGYFDLAHDQTIKLVNLTGAKLIGLERGSLMGRRFEVFVAKTDRPAFSSLLKKIFATGASQTCELTLVKDGQSTLNVRLEATRSPGGKECRVVLLDITELKQLEERLRQAQKMESIGQLAGGVAHEFNNILSMMILEIHLSRLVKHVPEEVCKSLEHIGVAAERAAGLTQQLLMFSRRQVMCPKVVDLNEVITHFAALMRRFIGDDVRFHLHLHPSPLLTCADTGMLELVLINLAVNARDAMPQGGQLLIATTEKTVDENLARLNPDAAPGRYVCLSVSDNGTGIPPEILPQIFEPFFTTKEVGKGTGLGLSTVFGIVKQHQGWIEVDNRPSRGVTFHICLPVNTTKSEPLEIAPKQSPPADGTETILFVEDEPQVRKPLRKMLEKAGYQVLEASDGVEAQKLWKKHQGSIALLLTDLMMPGGISGHELAASLQTHAPKLRVIFISGYSADIAGGKISLEEGKNFIQKPFSPLHLLKVIREILDERQAFMDQGVF